MITMKLQIVRVDNDLVEKADLQIGSNIIGRGSVTGCDDGRIIKHAVTIDLSANNEMTITPYQVSPCYIKSIGSSRWQLLKLGATVPLKPGDVCSLLSQKCWFKVFSVPDTMENNHEQASKRKADEVANSDIPDKRSCSESGEGDNVQSPSDILNEMLNGSDDAVKSKYEDTVTNNKTPSNKEETTDVIVSDLKDIQSASSVDEDKMQASSSKLTLESQNTDQSSALEKDDRKREDININKMAATVFPSEEAKENFKKNLEEYPGSESDSSVEVQDTRRPVPMQVDEPSASAAAGANVPRREKCRYGKKCYRKNVQHKAEFSHPGDSDYDIPDDREECPYGVKCYRKNPQHKIQFKHTAGNRRHRQAPAKVPSVTLSVTEESSAEESFEESVDESEYEPSSDIESSADETYSDKNGSEWDDGTTG